MGQIDPDEGKAPMKRKKRKKKKKKKRKEKVKDPNHLC
jgi:hypothetical protein